MSLDEQEDKEQGAVPLRLGFTVIVLLALALWFQSRSASTRIEETFERELRAVVATLGPTIPGEVHDFIDEVSFAIDPEEFEFIRTKLSDTVSSLQMKSDFSTIYTLRRSDDFDRTGDLVFVVMERPDPKTGKFFVGNRYKAQPFQLEAFEGTVSSSGLYDDEEGTWISAAAPILSSDGLVVGIVQADHQVRTYIERLREALTPLFAVSILTLITFGLFVFRSARLVKLAAQRGRDAEEALDALQETQARLVETEKMASLGQLVGGLAHELNTPIGVALTANSVVHEELTELNEAMQTNSLKKSMLTSGLSKMDETAQLAAVSLRRSAELIRRFKALSATQDESTPRVFMLNDLLDEQLELCREAAEASFDTLEWVSEYSEPVELYQRRETLARVVSECINNALTHGFQGRCSGTLAIRARRSDAEVSIIIQDSGAGLSDTDLAKVFDPFYTTKRADGRVGIGLTEAFNLVVHQLCGAMTIDGSPGAGTLVTITIPVSLRS